MAFLGKLGGYNPFAKKSAVASPMLPPPAPTLPMKPVQSRPDSAPLVTRGIAKVEPRLRHFERYMRARITRERIAIALLILLVVMLAWALFIKNRRKH